MRKNLFFILFVIFYASFSHAEFCNWGYAGPKIFRCNGENYYSGTAACNSGLYRNIFCHERFNQSGKECSDDNSPETMECYNRMTGARTEPAPRRDDEGFCNWGYAGPKIVTCEGQRFCFGSAACRTQMYSNIFCKEDNCGSGKKCADDSDAVTVRCYNRFIQTLPGGGGLQSPANGTRGIR